VNLVLLSDLHIGASPETYARCCRAFDAIHDLDPCTHVVALAGDLTEHGAEAEYRLALSLIEPLRAKGFRFVVVPGNHDFGPFGNHYHPGAHQRFESLFGAAPYVLETPAARIIGLDSCYQPGRGQASGWGKMAELFNPARRFANGALGLGQLDALSAWLEDGKPTHVILHHHPLYHAPGLRLVDANAFWRVVRNRAAGVYFGHRHVAGVYDGHEGVPVVRALGSVGHAGVVATVSLSRQAR
jgi:3',5'-cyclic AMP phosphodiesterase CpdA